MDPDNSPQSFSGVKRLNNFPLYLMIFIVSCFVLIMGFVFLKRFKKNSDFVQKDQIEVLTTERLASEIIGLKKGEEVVEKSLQKPLENEKSLQKPLEKLKKPTFLEKPGKPPEEVEDDDLKKIKILKFERFEEALIAETSIHVSLFKKELSESSSHSSESAFPDGLQVGSIIPALLISGINSELPGDVLAQVSESVYDTRTGRHLIIPQGTRLLGSYSSQMFYGQARLLVLWKTLIFPNGRTYNLGNIAGADSSGYSGFHDQENHHYFRIFSSAVLMSLITAGFSYSQDRNHDAFETRMSDEISQSLGQQLGLTVSHLISKNMNLSPTLEIRPGYRFNLIVTKELHV
jgi:hypothetical protein